MINLENVEKVYVKNSKKIQVLKNVTYKFKEKKFYCIIGKSGAGKSTLIQMIGLLLKQDDGNIIINNRSINNLSDNDKSDIRNQEIGFVFQSFYLNPLLTAVENVMLPGYLKNNNEELKERALLLLNILDLKGREYHYPKELSGGEQQRVAIARALFNEPNIILADEPTGALDLENEEKILKILKKLAESGKCVIVVSHNINVKKYADVILEIKNGILSEVKDEKYN